GCALPGGKTINAIFLLPRDAAVASAGVPTYTHDIAPILYQNCSSCHRPGQVAPFPLLSYEDAHKRAALIATVTASRYMPPWKADPGFGHFQDERRLTDGQIGLIRDWARHGAPEGGPQQKQAPPHFAPGSVPGEPH